MTRIRRWIEQYQPCGCSTNALTKAQLQGYCPDHGSEWSVRYSPDGKVQRNRGARRRVR